MQIILEIDQALWFAVAQDGIDQGIDAFQNASILIELGLRARNIGVVRLLGNQRHRDRIIMQLKDDHDELVVLDEDDYQTTLFFRSVPS